MKKVIGGHVYNTDSARKLADYSNKGDWNDFEHVEESLYKTKAGHYFLHGQGGPLTRYGSEEKIIPLTEEQAKAWGKTALDDDSFDRIFGDQDITALAIRVPRELFDRFNTLKNEKGLTAREMLEYLLDKAEEKA